MAMISGRTIGGRSSRWPRRWRPSPCRSQTGCRCRAGPCSKVKFPPLVLSPLAVGVGNDLIHLVGIISPEPEERVGVGLALVAGRLHRGGFRQLPVEVVA